VARVAAKAAAAMVVAAGAEAGVAAVEYGGGDFTRWTCR